MGKQGDDRNLRNHDFIGEPHEYNPRRLFSKTGTDYWGQVNFDQLREAFLVHALARLRERPCTSLSTARA